MLESSESDRLHIDEDTAIPPAMSGVTTSIRGYRNDMPPFALSASSLVESPGRLVVLKSIEDELAPSSQSRSTSSNIVDEGADNEAQELLVPVNQRADDDFLTVDGLTNEPTPSAHPAIFPTPAPPSPPSFSFSCEFATPFSV